MSSEGKLQTVHVSRLLRRYGTDIPEQEVPHLTGKDSSETTPAEEKDEDNTLEYPVRKQMPPLIPASSLDHFMEEGRV